MRQFSLGLILKIVKAAQSSLSPFIPDLVGKLLEALTALEPQEFNYMSFHAEKMDISQEQLETARYARVHKGEHCVPDMGAICAS